MRLCGWGWVFIQHFLAELFQAVVDAQTVFGRGHIVVQTGKQTHGRYAHFVVKRGDAACQGRIIGIIWHTISDVFLRQFQGFFNVVCQQALVKALRCIQNRCASQ